MTDQINIYGNAPAGDHNAVFVGCTYEHFKGAKLPNRCISGFLLVSPDGAEPLRDADGHEYYAAYTSNIPKGNNPKSSLYKLRQAMLQPYEYDPIDAAMGVPPWEHFTTRNPDGSRRIVSIRVEERRCENGKLVSIVTHLRRPRDGAWQDLRGKFEGPSDATLRQSMNMHSVKKGAKTERVYSWLLPDGSRRKLTSTEYEELPLAEGMMYMEWSRNIDFNQRWFTPEKVFIELPLSEVDALRGLDLARYETARIKNNLGMLLNN